MVYHFHGHLPTFRHAAKDLATFRMFIAGLVANGTATPGQMAQAFGISVALVKRAVKRLKEQGPRAFYARRPGRGPTVLTPEKLQGYWTKDRGLGQWPRAWGSRRTACARP